MVALRLFCIGFCNTMRNVSVVPLLRRPQPESAPIDAEEHALLPHPIPLVIGILVGTQVIIILSILVYVLRCSRAPEKSSSLYNEIGRSPPFSGPRFWARLKAKLRRCSDDRYAKKSSKYNLQETNFLEKWRQNKRDTVAQRDLKAMSSPV